MAIDPMTEDEAKRRFVEQVDALNLRTQANGPDPDSAARMSAIITEHERKCAALASAERASRHEEGEPKRLGS